MNKLIKTPFIFLTALMAVFLSLQPVYAKSGCCSGHDGVNCDAGPQSDGKVICNDGWRGSSCNYSEMVMCGGYTAPAVEPPAPSPYVYNPPSPSPAPQISSPKPSLKPSPSPELKPSPSSSPSPSPSPQPSLTPEQSPSTRPVSSPEVKGVKTEPASTTKTLGGLGTMGALGWGGYKLIKYLLKRVNFNK